jgi:hypothetical protein
VDEARTSSDILALLKADGNLARYGFFDALAIFSSTLILMMSSTMNYRSDEKDSERIEKSFCLLKAMKDEGNLPAIDFHELLLELKHELDLRGNQMVDTTMQSTHVANDSSGPQLQTGLYLDDASWWGRFPAQPQASNDADQLAAFPWGVFEERSEYGMTYLQPGEFETANLSY